MTSQHNKVVREWWKRIAPDKEPILLPSKKAHAELIRVCGLCIIVDDIDGLLKDFVNKNNKRCWIENDGEPWPDEWNTFCKVCEEHQKGIGNHHHETIIIGKCRCGRYKSCKYSIKNIYHFIHDGCDYCKDTSKAIKDGIKKKKRIISHIVICKACKHFQRHNSSLIGRSMEVKAEMIKCEHCGTECSNIDPKYGVNTNTIRMT